MKGLVKNRLNDMTRVVEPLNPKAERTHQRILTKLAYHLSLEIRKREGKKEVEP